MGLFNVFVGIGFGMGVLIMFMLWRLIYTCWVLPNMAYRKLKRNGLSGPTPSFPLGNISDMRKKKSDCTSLSSSSSLATSNPHDIHSSVFPYFSRWQKSHGKP